MYVYQIITLYTLNMHYVIYQLYIIKAEKNRVNHHQVAPSFRHISREDLDGTARPWAT